MKKFAFTIIAMVFLSGAIFAQELLPPVFSFSHKKTSYVTLKDGSTIEGTIKSLERKKGLLEDVKIKDGSGKKWKLKPSEIAYMYLPASGYDKFSNNQFFFERCHKMG